MENKELFPSQSFETGKPPRELQRDFFKAVETDDAEKLGELKKRYETEYPDQLEGVEAIFGLKEFLRKQKNIDEDKEKGDYKIEKSRFRDLTEYQFLFTHYMIENGGDKELLSYFWDTAKAIAKRTGTLAELNKSRRGLLSQVAVYKILDKLGEKPRLSHPETDAFHAVDLWLRNDSAVQVKGSRHLEKPAVIGPDQIDQIAFPALQAETESETRYYNAKYFHDSMRFRAKVKNYARMKGENIKPYLLIIPYSQIDFVTGEPAPELVEFFKEKLGSGTN